MSRIEGQIRQIGTRLPSVVMRLYNTATRYITLDNVSLTSGNSKLWVPPNQSLRLTSVG